MIFFFFLVPRPEVCRIYSTNYFFFVAAAAAAAAAAATIGSATIEFGR